MPADVTLNSGSGGAIIATDPTTSSEHYQLIKLAQGAVGTFTLVTTANALPVVTGSSFQGGITSLSSQITVTATGPVTITSGTVTLSSVPTIFSASSGGVQAFFPISPTSSVAGTGFGPVTSSAGVLASLSSGTVSLSSQISVTATAGTNPWSSAPGFNVPVVSVSSGLVQVIGTPLVNVVGTSSGVAVVTTSGGLTVSLSSAPPFQSTAATNPWSSAPGFNVPVVNASSGLVQISGTPTVVVATSAGLTQTVTVLNTSSGLVQVIPIGMVSSLGYLSTYFQSTGGAASVSVRSSASSLMGYSLFNSTAAIRSVKLYNTTSAPTVGSTTNVLLILMAPGSTGGGGANLMLPPPGLFSSNGIGFTMTANVAGTDTGAPGSNDLTLNLYFV